MLTVTLNLRENSERDRSHTRCARNKACLHVGALVLELPRVLREKAQLIVLQAWFDESGKSRNEGPVYLLAGYVGDAEMWKDFADDWQRELDRNPRLPYLHVKESQLFKGMTPEEREQRLLGFVSIIEKYKPKGLTFMLRHADYQEFSRILAMHPLITAAERRMTKNPYYHMFVSVLGATFLKHVEKCEASATEEPIEILFDEGMDRLARLKLGFESFIETVKRRKPETLPLLVNKHFEARDDKLFKPLQACDLLAWHLRRLCTEIGAGRITKGMDYDNPIWQALRAATEYDDHQYRDAHLIEILMKMHVAKWSPKI